PDPPDDGLRPEEHSRDEERAREQTEVALLRREENRAALLDARALGNQLVRLGDPVKRVQEKVAVGDRLLDQSIDGELGCADDDGSILDPLVRIFEPRWQILLRSR